MYTDEDGMVVIRGRLPQDVAALLQKALEAAMDALKEEEEKDGDHSDGGSPSHDSAETSEEIAQADLHDSAQAPESPSVSVTDDSAEEAVEGVYAREPAWFPTMTSSESASSVPGSKTL